MTDSPLISLVQSEAVITQELMTEILAPLLGFTDVGDVLPTSKFASLDPKMQTLVLLVAVKAMEILGMRRSGSVGPTELAKLGGIPAGTVKPVVRELAKHGQISSQGGKYWVTTNQVHQIALLLRTTEGLHGN